MVSILGCKVDHDYLFKNNGEFDLPKFPLQITLTTPEDLIRILADLCVHTQKRGGINAELCRNLIYLLHNLEYLKKWTNLPYFDSEIVRLAGIRESDSKRVIELFRGYCWRKLANENSAEFTELVKTHSHILREYASDLPLLKVGSATRYAEIREIYPCYFNGGELWDNKFEDEIYEIRGKTPYSVFAIGEQVASFMDAKKRDLAEALMRRAFYDKLSEESLLDETTFLKFFKASKAKNLFTEQEIIDIFSRDYKGAYSGSKVGRELYMRCSQRGAGIGMLGSTKIDSFFPSDAIDKERLRVLLKKESEEFYEEMEHLVSVIDKPEVLFYELAEVRGDAWFKYGAFAEALNNKKCCAKIKLANAIADSKLYVEGNLTASQAAMYRLPIFVTGDTKIDREYDKIFTPEYKNIHGCSAWEFYGGMSDRFRELNKKSYITHK